MSVQGKNSDNVSTVNAMKYLYDNESKRTELFKY